VISGVVHNPVRSFLLWRMVFCPYYLSFLETLNGQPVFSPKQPASGGWAAGLHEDTYY